MSTHKHIDRICCIVLAFALVLTVLFMFGESLGIEVSARPLGYETRLFSTDKVHTIDIIIDDWDEFISTATSEEYSVCSVVIDGEAIKNVGIRGKGNTSLSSVSSMGSERYSFKIEFDQYDNTKSYYGLDKLSLNNVIQDNTYMKDYLVYQMMNEFGVSAPLCSFVYITVNGEDWGLYLAVEGVEDGFLQRNYGSDYGELYKPDSLSFGGGRGNGMDFDISDFMGEDGSFDFSFGGGSGAMPDMGSMFGGDSGAMPDMGSMFGGGSGTMPDMGNMPSRGDRGETDGESSSRPEGGSSNSGFTMPDTSSFGGMGNIGGMFGMGSSDVKLQYIDDDPSSYSNIFSSAKTDITEADQNRLIASLKQLSSYENIEDVVDVETVLRYFVVHNYSVNSDSYTGSMIHNYYLYEEDGKLSMIPWDYNLAFGTFMGSNGSSSVNESIDEVLSDRPMQAWIFSDEEYTVRYYELYAQLLSEVDIQGIIDDAYTLIAPYVAKDPTAFCTYEEFEAGVETLKEFCTLRSESVSLQLAGSDETVDASGLDISAMGTMGGGMGGGFGGGSFGGRGDSSTMPTRPDSSSSSDAADTVPASYDYTDSEKASETGEADSSGQTPWESGNMPDMGDFDMSNIPNMGDFDMSSIPSGGMSSQDGTQGGQRPGGSIGSIGSIGTAGTSPISGDTVMLIVTAAILAAGLVFAALFKRRR